MNGSGTRPPLAALIVLGARLNPRGEPGRVAQLRLRHALQLWREHHPGCRILLTGARRPGTATSEAQAMAAWSLDWTQKNWGIDARHRLADCLVLEEASHNTAASAANTLPLVQGPEVKAVGLVSDSLHIRRAHYLFRRRFARHGITVHPLAARGLLRHYWRQRRYLWLAQMALREGGAWLKVLGSLAFGRGRRNKQ
ncbi:MAG: YdcF family protein [Deltaproteobacteria bacterium]|nr:YdcF family protein [Deltaproteobacteria bacterium]